MKKFVISESEKNRILDLHKSKYHLIENADDDTKFILRRLETAKDILNSELELTAGVCFFKKDDDLDGYINHASRSIARSMFIDSGHLLTMMEPDLTKYVNTAQNGIKNMFTEELKKHYESTDC